MKFSNIERYVDRLKENRAKAGAADAVTITFSNFERPDVTIAVQDFAFQGRTCSSWRRGKRWSQALCRAHRAADAVRDLHHIRGRLHGIQEGM